MNINADCLKPFYELLQKEFPNTCVSIGLTLDSDDEKLSTPDNYRTHIRLGVIGSGHSSYFGPDFETAFGKAKEQYKPVDLAKEKREAAAKLIAEADALDKPATVEA